MMTFFNFANYYVIYFKTNLILLWVDLCKSFLLEAKWYHIGYKPTLEEYLDNAWTSIGGPVVLVHAYVFMASPKLKNVESLKELDIIRWSTTIFRLADDLGTSTVSGQ